MLHWRLHYNDLTRPTLEPQPGLASIVDAPKDAVALEVVGDDGEGVVGCQLSSTERPIFYTIRSITGDMVEDKGGDGRKRWAMRMGKPRTDIVIFGRGWESGARIESLLWAVWRDGRVTDCPPRFLDEQAIERAVMGA